MKKLFLASEAKHPESINKLDQFVGGLRGKKVVYIPTAVNGDRPKYKWENGGSAKLVQSLGVEIQFLELENNDDDTIHKTVKSGEIIWIAGGMGGYLMYWLNRTKLNLLIPEVVNKGTIYVGSSAGSWVCSSNLSVAEWFMGDPEPGAKFIPGMGLVNFEMYPHYEDSLLPEIKKYWEKEDRDLYLLKNGEAITIVGNKIEVLGEKRILRNGEIVHE